MSHFQILGLTTYSSENDLRRNFRNLVKEWHPDKHNDPKMKKIAEDKFIQINEAYERLSVLRAKRTQQNKKTPS